MSAALNELLTSFTGGLAPAGSRRSRQPHTEILATTMRREPRICSLDTGRFLLRRWANELELYLRVSTEDQTVENQRQALRAAAEHRGWTVVKEFVDAGISGAKGREKRGQGVDTSTPAGKALFQMLGVFAEFERSIIQERIQLETFYSKCELPHTPQPIPQRCCRTWADGPSIWEMSVNC
jgi:hypothetical protein